MLLVVLNHIKSRKFPSGSFLCHLDARRSWAYLPIFWFDSLQDCTNENCEGYCEQCAVEYHLNVVAVDGERDVTSRDLQLEMGDPSIMPVDTEYPVIICKLATNQAIKLRAFAKKVRLQAILVDLINSFNLG